MEENHDQSYNFFSLFSPRILLVAFVIVVTLILVSGAAFGAESETPPRLDRSESRAQDTHTRLMVTAAQEEHWGSR